MGFMISGCGNNVEKKAQSVIASINIAIGEESEDDSAQSDTSTNSKTRHYDSDKLREIIESEDFSSASSSETLLSYLKDTTVMLGSEEEYSLIAVLYEELAKAGFENDELRTVLHDSCFRSEETEFIKKIDLCSLLSGTMYYAPEKISVKEIEQWIKENSVPITMKKGYGGFYDGIENYTSGDKYQGWSISQDSYQYFGDFCIKTETTDRVSELDYELTHSVYHELRFRDCILRDIDTIKAFAYAPPFLFSNNGSMIQIYQIGEGGRSEHKLDVGTQNETSNDSLWVSENSEPTEEQKKYHEEYVLVLKLKELEEEDASLDEFIPVYEELSLLNEKYGEVLELCSRINEYAGSYKSYKRVGNSFGNKEEEWDYDHFDLEFTVKSGSLVAKADVKGKNIDSASFDEVPFGETEDGIEMKISLTFNKSQLISQTVIIEGDTLRMVDSRPASFTIYFEKE